MSFCTVFQFKILILALSFASHLLLLCKFPLVSFYELLRLYSLFHTFFILQEKKLFSSVLLDSRLVAKFLGFVTFLPYQSPDKLPDNVESTYIAIRSKVIMCCLHVLYTTFEAALSGFSSTWYGFKPGFSDMSKV